jgi:protoporphyrin/coproporphyrin ferrochelatase
MARHHDAVLLLAFGSPNSPAEIRPFLARVLHGRPVPGQRVEEVVRHYEAVGGRSPLTEITLRQAAALERLLRKQGAGLAVYVGLRHSSPFIIETLRQMASDGVTRAFGFILSTHQTEASWERYQTEVAEARAALGSSPEVEFCPGWHDHPLLIQSLLELIKPALDRLGEEERRRAALIFTAHSIPKAMAARSPYEAQIWTTARLLAEQLDHPRWSVAYQSRSGRPEEPWLDPDIGEALRASAAEGVAHVVVAPIGFVCDHVEVLYDLDVEAREIAEGLGIRFVRAPSLNDHATFVRMIADVVAASAGNTAIAR